MVQTDQNHIDYKNLKNAVAEIKKLNEYLNDAMKLHEANKKMAVLEKVLSLPGLVQPDRFFRWDGKIKLSLSNDG